MFLEFLWLAFWLTLVLGGAKVLVDQATKVAEGIGVPPLLVSLTVIALGTSLPELVISVGAARTGSPEIALGNVIGSNIANILLVLGVCALIRPLPVASQTLKLDAPYMLAISVVLVFFAWNDEISGLEAWLLVALGIVYTVLLLFELLRARRAGADRVADDGAARPPKRLVLLWTLFGIVGGGVMMYASEFVVESAKSIAKGFGMSEAMVGITIVAVGTSLPELISSGYAAYKHRADMALGGLVGSNLCNIMVVLGLTGIVAQNGIVVPPGETHVDVLIMAGVAAVGYWFARTGSLVSRAEGGVFLALYVGFLGYKLASL